MRHCRQAASVVLLAALLLTIWTARRPVAPEPRRDADATAPASAAPSSPTPSDTPAPQAEPARALADTPARPRLELVRRCLHLAETDPLAAMDLAIAQKLTDDAPGLLNALILRWAERDFSGALEWARAQPRDAGRDEILARLAFLRSRDNPAEAAELASAEITAGRGRAEAILSVVHQWAEQNPSAAQAWSARLSDADLRQRALDDIAATGAQRQVALASGSAPL